MFVYQQAVAGRLSEEVCTFIRGQILPLLTQVPLACLQPIETICLDFQGYRIMSAKKKESKLTSLEISQQHEQAAGTKKKKEEKKERKRNGEIIWKIISSFFVR